MKKVTSLATKQNVFFGVLAVASLFLATGMWACDSCGCSASATDSAKTCTAEASKSTCDSTEQVSVKKSCDATEQVSVTKSCDKKESCEAAKNCEYAKTGEGAKACPVADKCEAAKTCEYVKSGKCPTSCCAVKTGNGSSSCTVAVTAKQKSSCSSTTASAYTKECPEAKSCHTQEVAKHNHPHHKTIVETAVSTGKFKTLTTALKAAGLVEALEGKGPFTVFAPTDKAFAKLPKGTVATLLKPENRSKLQAVLKYHVVAGKEFTASTLSNRSLKTLQGSKIRAKTCPKNGVSINNARVTKADIRTKNGVIHVINTVLLPPAKQAEGVSGKQETSTPTAYDNAGSEKKTCGKTCGK